MTALGALDFACGLVLVAAFVVMMTTADRRRVPGLVRVVAANALPQVYTAAIALRVVLDRQDVAGHGTERNGAVTVEMPLLVVVASWANAVPHPHILAVRSPIFDGQDTFRVMLRENEARARVINPKMQLM